MISDSVDQQLYNDTKLDQFGQVLKSAMLVYLSVELPNREHSSINKSIIYPASHSFNKVSYSDSGNQLLFSEKGLKK